MKSFSAEALYKCFLFLLFLFPLLASGGCASLPKPEEIQAPSSTETPPKIVGPKGELPPKKSEAIMKRLERGAEVTNILQQDIALMEPISGSPLVAGNRVTLLVDGPATYAAMMKAIQNAVSFSDTLNLNRTFVFLEAEGIEERRTHS